MKFRPKLILLFSVISVVPITLLIILAFVASFDQFRDLLLFVGISFSALAIFFALYLAKILTEPIMAMRRAASEISKGRFNKRLNVQSKDELGDLAHSFNEMAEHLQAIDQSKNDFIHLAAHQLRTPQTIMGGYIEELLVKYAKTMSIEEVEYIEAIKHGNEGLRDVTETLLNVSQLQTGSLVTKPSPVDVAQIVAEVMREYTPSVRNRGLRMEGLIDKKLPKIQSDPRLIRVIVRNLLTNALFYTTKGSITVSIHQQSEAIVIAVADTGCGIPEADHGFIFSKFFRSDNAKRIVASGTGLGLYLVKLCVEKLGAKIWFTSQLDHGTTFYVSLPRTT
jgi:signal transduction histidine kinase